jgi:hypothetical protein
LVLGCPLFPRQILVLGCPLFPHQILVLGCPLFPCQILVLGCPLFPCQILVLGCPLFSRQILVLGCPLFPQILVLSLLHKLRLWWQKFQTACCSRKTFAKSILLVCHLVGRPIDVVQIYMEQLIWQLSNCA